MINEGLDEINKCEKEAGKICMIWILSKKYLWTCIGFIFSAVTYGKK